jgi:hypothetical protein
VASTEEEKKKPRGETIESAKVDPVPKRQDFTDWLSTLFTGENQFPEKLHVCAVSGPMKERLGPTVKQIVYGPKDLKPNKEAVVKLSNEILHLIQRDCDIQRKEMVYGVHAAHFSRETEYYERFLIRCKPTGVHRGDGDPREEDDELETPQVRREKQQLDHGEQMFALYKAGFEGLLDRMDRIVERQDSGIEKRDSRIERLGDMLEKALSLEEERAQRRMWTELKIKAVDKGLDMGLALAPPLLNQLVGKKVIPTDETSETLTLKNFFKLEKEGGKLTEAQSIAAFGKYSDKEPFEQLQPGVLTYAQAKLLYDVANCNIPVDRLDDLLPGGSLGITQEQGLALATQCGFSMDQVMPIQLLFDARMKRRLQQQK